MATLVLSTVGNALGGPVGGAIGALIGQSIDQQLLAPARRGPRLGDLSVQSSSYGTQVPRIYGSMRVAGSVIWATDLIESHDFAGAKGQPDISYAYTVSLAVALSSRPVSGIGRIWADGKLLRGAEGDFKVATTFRFYDGSEDQEIDPLIASIEGIANTAAYRGLALAVFENLELGEFGNRIPFMTFEVIADAEPPGLSAILNDASDGMIESDAPDTMLGFAAYGSSMASAVQPLVECFDVKLFDDGAKLRAPLGNPAVLIDAGELGSSADAQRSAVLEREQVPVREVPSTLRLTYYDPARDYQSGEARAIAGEQVTNEAHTELPAVISADDAKTLVEQMLGRSWATRDRLTLRLPPARMGLEPGSTAQSVVARGSWVIEKSTIDGFVTILKLRPAAQSRVVLSGDPGRVVPNPDIVESPTSIALLDIANPMQTEASGPAILIAASAPSAGWSARALTLACSGQTFQSLTAARKSILGRAETVLSDADPYLIDETGAVDIQLIDPQQWLTSCDDEALAGGTNLAVLGRELLQFAAVTPLGEGRFRLKRLLRGRGGTEWAAATHAIGEDFCLIDGHSMRSLSLASWMRGLVVTATDRHGSSSSVVFQAQSVTPLQPVQLAAEISASGDLSLSWIRRSRSGFAWVDEIDAPIGESLEQYRVTITGTAQSLEFTSGEPKLLLSASDLAVLGVGEITIEVRQVGDWAASRPARLTITLE